MLLPTARSTLLRASTVASSPAAASTSSASRVLLPQLRAQQAQHQQQRRSMVTKEERWTQETASKAQQLLSSGGGAGALDVKQILPNIEARWKDLVKEEQYAVFRSLEEIQKKDWKELSLDEKKAGECPWRAICCRVWSRSSGDGSLSHGNLITSLMSHFELLLALSSMCIAQMGPSLILQLTCLSLFQHTLSLSAPTAHASRSPSRAKESRHSPVSLPASSRLSASSTACVTSLPTQNSQGP